MKKIIISCFMFLIILIMCSCANQKDIDNVIAKISNIGTVTLDSENKITEAEEAYATLNENEKEQVTNYDDLTLYRLQFDVIYKFTNELEILGTGKFIEDAYKKYTEDPVISNIYFYMTALEEYDFYMDIGIDKDLDIAIEYAAKIDPDYEGIYSKEMHDFVDTLIPEDQQASLHTKYLNAEIKYNNLTDMEKKEIGFYIYGRYKYYDELNGGYSGDKYSDEIMELAAEVYDLTPFQVSMIWMDYYSY